MAARKLTSREFNQDTARAKRAAQEGPVYITDRGEPSHVLLTFDDYVRLSGDQSSLIDRLAAPPGVEAVDFEAPSVEEFGTPAEFE